MGGLPGAEAEGKRGQRALEPAGCLSPQHADPSVHPSVHPCVGVSVDPPAQPCGPPSPASNNSRNCSLLSPLLLHGASAAAFGIPPPSLHTCMCP